MHPHDTTNEIPYGYCHCGCGQKTKIASKTRNERGWVKGQPIHYIHGHNGLRYASPLEAFMTYYAPAAADECWLWAGSRLNTGYGYFRVDHKHYLAHRFSYEFYKESIPPGAEVCHHCDTPACYNPAHLFLGTHRENMADKVAKGRNVTPNLTGAAHPRTKLTSEQIIAIRESFVAQHVDIRTLARQNNVTKSTILAIVHGQRWSEVAGPIAPSTPDQDGSNNPASKLTEAQVIAIRAEYATGTIGSYKLASKYGVAKPTILRIIHRLTWTHI